MHSHIMVSYDGSDESLDALDEAKQILQDAPAMKLDIVQVIDEAVLEPPMDMTWGNSMTGYSTVDPQVVARLHERAVQRALDKMHETLDAHLQGIPNPVAFHVEPQTVSVADSLLDFAKHHDIDLIIMGCRGLGAIRGVLGSVSYAVLRGADVPVLIVK